MKKTTTFILIIFVNILMYSQKPLNYPYVDKTTYEYYLKADWDALINLGKESLSKDIDFYYLQVRMGVAYFAKNNFRKSIPYFQKAYNTNPDDEFVLAYLYKAYKYSGRLEDAQKLETAIPNLLKKTLNIKSVLPIFSSVYIETKTDTWDDYKINNDETDILTQDVRKSFNYFSINFENRIRSKSKIFWGYTYVKNQKNIYKPDENNHQLAFTQDVKQNQLYFQYGNQYGNGGHLAVSLNYIFYEYIDYEKVRYGSGFGSNAYDFIKIKNHELAGNISLFKDISLFRIGADTSVSTFSESFQLQPSVNLTFYPFGNTNLYLTGEFTQQYDFLSDKTRTDNLYELKLGTRIKTLYFEPYFSIGKLAKFTRNNAFVIYNDKEYIQDEIGIKAYAYLFKNKLNIYAEYKTYDRINSYQINDTELETIYNNKSIIAGLKWNF